MLYLNNYENPEVAVVKLLKSLAIAIDAETIITELYKHPDYPSLLAVSDVLTAFKIENYAFRLTPDELTGLPCPFIAHTNTNGGEFLVVTKITGDYVYVSNEKWNSHKLSKAGFNKIFAGVVLTVQPSDVLALSKNRFNNF